MNDNVGRWIKRGFAGNETTLLLISLYANGTGKDGCTGFVRSDLKV